MPRCCSCQSTVVPASRTTERPMMSPCRIEVESGRMVRALGSPVKLDPRAGSEARYLLRWGTGAVARRAQEASGPCAEQLEGYTWHGNPHTFAAPILMPGGRART